MHLCWKLETFKKGYHVPPAKEGPKLSEEDLAKKAREWILKGMKDDAETADA